ncbi:MAG: O-antigen ligase family protein [Clostridia bacterium]|nr:O-antigen ligase family protein [Clostridia bacterium]
MRNENGIKLNYMTGIMAEFALLLLIVLFTLFHVKGGVSPVFYLTFIVLIPLIVKSMVGRAIPWALLFLVFTTLLNVTVNAMLSRIAKISFEYFFKMIMFLCTMLYFWSVSETVIDEKSGVRLTLIPMLMGIFMIASYYLLGNRTQIAGCITLGFVNPNFTGMWLTHVLLYGVYIIVSVKKPLVRVPVAAISLLCLVLIWNTFTRSCFFGLAFFAIMMFVGKVWNVRKLSPVMVVLIILLPLICALFYLFIADSTWFSKLFDFIVRPGKKLNARDEIWRVTLNMLKNNPLIGCYSEISNGTGLSQLHNTHIDVLCSYGVIPFVLFIVSLTAVVGKVNQRIRSFRQFTALSAFLSIIVIGSFEAAIVSGSTGLYILSGGFLLLSSEWKSDRTD